MSDFWSRVAGNPAPTAPAYTGPPVATKTPWWQDPPTQQPAASPYGVQAASGGQLTTEQVARAAQAEGHNISRAQHLKNEENCPGCGGGDYMSPPGSTRRRCFDCGYPLVQQGSGVSVTTSSGKGTAARQVDAGGKIAHNYHPGVIEDRIS